MVILRQIPQNYLFSKIDLKKLIVPLVIEQFLTIAVGLIDSMMVASVGESAVSAISLVDTVNILIINNAYCTVCNDYRVCAEKFYTSYRFRTD